MLKPELYRCGLRESWQRQIGELPPRAFAHRIGGSQDLIRRLQKYAELDGHSGCVNTVHFNPSGDILVSGSDDTQIVFWDWAAKEEKFSFSSGHIDNVFQARIMPYSDDRSIVTCAADGQVRHAQLSESGLVETTSLVEHRGRAHKLAVEPGSPRTFYSCGEDGAVYHFDLRENSCTRILVCHGLSFQGLVRLNSIAINPRNPNYYSVGGSDQFARVYDIRQVQNRGLYRTRYAEDPPVDVFCPKHLTDSEDVHITCVAYSQQEELLVSYNDELIYLFEKGMGIDSCKIKPRKYRGPKTRALRPYKRGLVQEEEDEKHKQVKEEEKEEEEVDDAGGEESRAVPPAVYRGHRNSQTVKGVNFFGPSDEYVVSGSDCGHIFIWKKRGAELVALLKGDKQVVNCLEPHPYSTVLATSGIDSTVKIWTPTAAQMNAVPGESARKIMERNQNNREKKLSPNIIMLRFLQRINSARRRSSESPPAAAAAAAGDDPEVEDADEEEQEGSSTSDSDEEDESEADEGNPECVIH